MTEHTDKGLNLGNFVFYHNNQDPQSWKCFGQTCNRSLVVFLSQFFVILRRTTLSSCSDKQEISISQHRWNGYQWSFLTKIDLKKEEYRNLVDNLPTLLSYIDNYKKTCIILDQTTQS